MEKVQYKNNASWQESNMKRMQHEKSATSKKYNMNRV